ncbi:type II toxin-antitoxin system HicB family antitoxin [Bartonella sp. DGB2]|uniref:type II toxin-antitoxin system HicB family antitoxin n=1 Tax=Bartonella sp. DGB2 TaxID=3388426 RepID=UPI00398FC005
MDYTYHAKIERDPDGGYIVTFPDVPEAITAGDDWNEALANAQQALGLALRSYYMREKSPPPSLNHAGLTPISLDVWNALKLETIRAFQEAGITKVELAKRLHKKEVEARRILNANHPTKIQTLEKALNVLGKKAVVSVQEAA